MQGHGFNRRVYPNRPGNDAFLHIGLLTRQLTYKLTFFL